MRYLSTLTAVALLASPFAWAAPAALSVPAAESNLEKRSSRVTPKVMIISMFTPERQVWIEPMNLTVNYTIPGLSPLFQEIACNTANSVCIITTGEAEINAAATISALALSDRFNLKHTYFMVAGIAGVNPYMGTLGTAAWARFAVQVGLEYELDARQLPANWTTGYWSLGTAKPGLLPNVTDLYGTELFELNTNLLQRALNLTQNLTLNDTSAAQKWRSNFNYGPANQAPKVTQGEVLTSDVYFAGTLLAESFGNLTNLVTKGQAAGKTYTMTAQEDNATLEALMRAHRAGLVDYSRILVLRTASDFDRAPPINITAYDAFEAEQGGFGIAIQNLVVAGKPVVLDIVNNWASIYKAGIAPQSGGNGSFYGDNLGTIRTGPAQARRMRRRSYVR